MLQISFVSNTMACCYSCISEIQYLHENFLVNKAWDAVIFPRNLTFTHDFLGEQHMACQFTILFRNLIILFTWDLLGDHAITFHTVTLPKLLKNLHGIDILTWCHYISWNLIYTSFNFFHIHAVKFHILDIHMRFPWSTTHGIPIPFRNLLMEILPYILLHEMFEILWTLEIWCKCESNSTSIAWQRKCQGHM